MVNLRMPARVWTREVKHEKSASDRLTEENLKLSFLGRASGRLLPRVIFKQFSICSN